MPGAGGALYEAEATEASPDVRTQKAVGPPNARAGGKYVQGRGRRDVGAPILVCRGASHSTEEQTGFFMKVEGGNGNEEPEKEEL